MLEAFILAVGLAMDATAVAAARSVSGVPRRALLGLAVAFGVAQSAMSAIGWQLGASASKWISRWDHWIAFGLLLLIGAKMLIDAVRGGEEDQAKEPPTLSGRTVFMLAIATSIDALAAGVTLTALASPPLVALALIGIVTFVLSALGGLVGARLGEHLGSKLEVLGGIALIGIGVKTLIDHLYG
jgi:putative Mn2+ efflux pump MntP